ncbi:MAG: glutathione S-transferase family protein [Alcaligenaceae bacterium]|nr:glutathione S-transferase family protein [Alcaligenaceae bacterium]
MITIFHLPSTGSFRSIWLACELGLTFQLNRREESADSSSETHPLSKAPMLLDGDISIATHGAAREYLLSSYDRSGMRPPMAHPDYIQYLQWVHYLESTLLPLVDQQRIINKLGQSRVPFFARSIMKKTVLNYVSNHIEPELNRQLNYIDKALAESGWTCGSQFCAADIDLAYILLALESESKLSTEHKNIEMFLNAVKERATYQLAKEKSTITSGALSYDTPSSVIDDADEAIESEVVTQEAEMVELTESADVADVVQDATAEPSIEHSEQSSAESQKPQH